ncbi:3-phosphoshikimate 1-carboxyvinyltransferase [Flavobacteriales bacterium]|nr:3-phosphoshikimate 1-carboxyvinyltransferase [Flavobacteriales bacterium]
MNGEIDLPASKSECNRALIIQQLLESDDSVGNISAAADTVTLQRILRQYNSGLSCFDVGPAGTTMRFLTAYFATQKGVQELTGSERMKERPIHILVDALRKLGAQISYLGKEGYPPIRIEESYIKGGAITIDGGVSSQYLSALMLVAPHFEKPLTINIENDLVSRPYLEMTASLMHHFGATVDLYSDKVSVAPSRYVQRKFNVESDWSAASYWYQMIAYVDSGNVFLKGLKEETLQGDAVLASIFNSFGVTTSYEEGGVRLTKQRKILPKSFQYDFTLCPDLAQTVAVTCAGLGIEAVLTGLKTLKIKETDRIEALQNELKKLGVNSFGESDSLHIQGGRVLIGTSVATYHDHRMAMAFAPLAINTQTISIENPEVVEKSYPSFWTDLEKVGFLINP